MDITVVGVPKGIRYISDWKEFSLPETPQIIDKQIPGCGFTEYCLTNSDNVILCSPRKILLENKEEQHAGKVHLVKSLYSDLGVDKDIERRTLRNTVVSLAKIEEQERLARENAERNYKFIETGIDNYWSLMGKDKMPCKILVTYDSFRKVKETLIKMGVFDQFFVVVDEFQSIFVDSRFKPDTEMEFLDCLQDVKKLCYVSATPMIETYLDRLDEFKDLPYIRLDWAMYDEKRVKSPDLDIKVLKAVKTEGRKIIESYKSGNFKTLTRVDKETGEIVEHVSKEAVIYVNSVNNLIQIIKDNLEPEEVNILCADTQENRDRIKKNLGKRYDIGKVPTRNEPRKMFTICTRTVYLGADFYSDNARTFIISDANIESLAVDITLDLPQIMGRQRLSENPWKDQATIYVKTLSARNKVSIDAFEKLINKKKETTLNLLTAYDDVRKEAKHDLAGKYLKDAIRSKYADDYVAVNKHKGSDWLPVYNTLALVSEERAYEIQQLDYADRFTVFNRINTVFNLATSEARKEAEEFMEKFESLDYYGAKMKLLCETEFSKDAKEIVLEQIPETYNRYYLILGPERCRALGYNYVSLKKETAIKKFDSTIIRNKIYEEFKEGDLISRSDAKFKLSEIYKDVGYQKTPKASDLGEWFELKESKIVNPETKKRDGGFELLKKKN